MAIYGGDEVSAVVLDIGTSTTRAGYAGDDCPKSVVPTSYSYVPGDETLPTRFFLGASSGVYRAGQQSASPLVDSTVHDWEAAQRLVEYSFNDQLAIPTLEENPLLVSEPAWNSRENRERLIELAFEEWNTPAYYSVDRAALSAFASGKGTALVVDVGESGTCVMPVYDGFVLRKGIQRSPIGGALLNEIAQESLAAIQPPINIVPSYLVKSKKAVEPNLPPQAVLRSERIPNPAEPESSWHKASIRSVVSDFRESICEVYDGVWNDAGAMSRGQRPYEFPDGYNTYFGPQPRLTIPEVLFQPARFMPPSISNRELPTTKSTIPLPSYAQAPSIPHMIISSVNAIDPDILPHMLQNIVLVGGVTLTPGFVDRLNAEISALAQGYNVKIQAAGPTIERKFSSWLGGSILASLGTFNQLWIGKEEYLEHGRSIVHKRAK